MVQLLLRITQGLNVSNQQSANRYNSHPPTHPIEHHFQLTITPYPIPRPSLYSAYLFSLFILLRLLIQSPYPLPTPLSPPLIVPLTQHLILPFSSSHLDPVPDHGLHDEKDQFSLGGKSPKGVWGAWGWSPNIIRCNGRRRR